MQTWVAAETEGLDLGDARLNKRYRSILEDLGDKPSMSIMAACGGWSETFAAYRFFDNSSVTPDKILEPHRHATLKRMSMESVVLVAQDTTVLTLTRPEQQMAGAGPLSDEHNHGMFDHPCLALDAQGVPLGILSARLWSRDWETFYANKALTASEKAVAKRAIPFTDKESHRWLEGYMQGCQAAQACPQTQIVVVSDSEADIIDCFAYANEIRAKEEDSAHWITRAFQDRSLAKSHDHSKLWEACENAPVLTTLEVEVRENNPKSGDKTKRNQKRKARNTEVEVRVLTVEVKGQSRIEGKLAAQKINVVHTREINPPVGERPVEWLLLTSLDIGTIDNVVQVIRYYTLRWQIEEYHKGMKTGCQVESPQFTKEERLKPAIALLSIVTLTLLQLRDASRRADAKERKATEIISESYVEVLSMWRHKQVRLDWTIHEFYYALARLGGHQNRKHDHPPGWQVLWEGWKELFPMIAGYNIAKSKYKKCG